MVNQETGKYDLSFTLLDLAERKILDKSIDSESVHINTAALSPGVHLYIVSSKTISVKTGQLILQN